MIFFFIKKKKKKKNTHPKNFTKTSSILKNPKIFKKSQKVRSSEWNAWKRRIRTLTKWRKTWSRLKNPWGWSSEWEIVVLGGEEVIEIERDQKKWDLNRADPIYRSSVILDRLRGVKRCQGLKLQKIQLSRRCPQQRHAQWIEVAVKELSSRQKVSRWIEELLRSWRAR